MNKNSSKHDSYLPVSWDYREIIEEQINQKKKGRIFYFCESKQINESQGEILSLVEKPKEGVFIKLSNGEEIRIDRIITSFGKIGAAYDEYNDYANACMSCMGGFTQEEIDKL